MSLNSWATLFLVCNVCIKNIGDRDEEISPADFNSMFVKVSLIMWLMNIDYCVKINNLHK